MERCKFEICRNAAVFNAGFCWDHLEDRSAYTERLISLTKENTSFKGANLSKVDLNNMDLAGIDFSDANLSRADLSRANLFDANLKNAELVGVNLSDSDLTSANLNGSDLTRSCLQGARLWHANLESANLIEANLSHCDLWNAKLFNVRLWRTNLLQVISLSKKNFQNKIGKYVSRHHINEKGFLAAEEAYRSLKRYFLANGRYNDASWASFKEKAMEKLLLKKRKTLAYIPSLIMGLLCGYGEKPHRIILSSAFVILFYSGIFFGLNAITYTPAATYRMSLGDYIYYSVITFTTVGYGDFIPKSSLIFRFLAASEAFVGTFMIGLFIFTLARKYSAR